MDHVGNLVLSDAESFVGLGAYGLCLPKPSVHARLLCPPLIFNPLRACQGLVRRRHREGMLPG